jgi:GNAT superfamily N-acetyltransferase
MSPPWVIERLAREHDRASFTSGQSSLDGWLKLRATQFDKLDLARTYVALNPGAPTVLGYYAISNHQVAFEVLPDDETKGLPRIEIPVVLLGRLAVDRSAQGQGLGELLLVDALRRAQHLADQIGIRAVEVDAINEAARAFYEKYGFVRLRDDSRHLFLPMRVIRKLQLPRLS